MSDWVIEWRLLSPVFLREEPPEFVVAGLSEQALSNLLEALFESGRELITRFYLTNRQPIVVSSSRRAAQLLATGRLRGVFSFCLPCLPVMNLIVPGDGTLRVVPEISQRWTPIMLEALVQFLKDCAASEPEAQIIFDPSLPAEERNLLERLWWSRGHVPAL